MADAGWLSHTRVLRWGGITLFPFLDFCFDFPLLVPPSAPPPALPTATASRINCCHTLHAQGENAVPVHKHSAVVQKGTASCRLHTASCWTCTNLG